MKNFPLLLGLAPGCSPGSPGPRSARGEVYKAQLPVEREGVEPRFIAIKKIKKQNSDTPNNLSDEERRQLDKWSRQMQSEIRTVATSATATCCRWRRTSPAPTATTSSTST